MATKSFEVDPSPPYERQVEFADAAPPIGTSGQFGHLATPPARPVEFSLSQLLASARRRWILLSLCWIASGVAAYAAAKELGSLKAEVSGSLLHIGTSLPHESAARPSLETHAALMKSRPVLDSIAAHKGFRDGTVFENLLAVRTPRNAGVIEASLTLPDPALAADVLSELFNAFLEQAATIRSRGIAEHIDRLENTILANEAEAAKVVERLRNLRERQGNPQVEFEALEESRESLKSVRVAADSARLQASHECELLKANRAASAVKASQAMIDQKRARISKISERITSKHELWKEITAANAELDKLSASAETDQLSTEWRKRFAEVGRSFLPRLSAATTNRPLSQEVDFEKVAEETDSRISDLEQIVKAKEAQIAGLDGKLEENRRLRETMKKGLQPQRQAEADLSDILETYADNRIRLQHQVLSLRQFQKSKTPEFTILDSPQASAARLSTNHTKLFIAVFTLMGVVTSVPILAFDVFRRKQPLTERMSSLLNLPVLYQKRLTAHVIPEKVEEDEHALLERDVRLLALRIQQCLPDNSGLVAFSHLGGGDPPVEIIAKVARCLAQREHNVLLINSVHSQSTRAVLARELGHRTDTDEHSTTKTILRAPRGLSDFLCSTEIRLEETCEPRLLRGLYYMDAGQAEFPTEGWGSRRLTTLLDEVRSAFDIILIIGPGSTHGPDLHMLCAGVDGVVFTASEESNCTEDMVSVVSELRALAAPIFGIVG